MTVDIGNIKLSSSLTIDKYNKLLKRGENSKAEIAEFVFQRLIERYIIPMENVEVKYKNGFSIMANCCLLIETYECFRQGMKDTTKSGEGKRVFSDFFDRENAFKEFKGLGADFYGSVRCGILHQGETKDGWTISRNSSNTILNKKDFKINANLFLLEMRRTLKEYKEMLIIEEWTSDIWVKCRNKIGFIIANCTK